MNKKLELLKTRLKC